MNAFFTPQQFAAAAQANVDAMLSLTNSAFAKVERLTALNLNVARAALNDRVADVNALLAVRDVQGLVNLQATLAQPIADKATAYARGVYEIASESQEEVAKLFEAQLAEMNKTVAGALEQAAKSAPAGSEVLFDVVRSAIAATNSAYDNVSQAAKQVSKLAEANIAGTALKAVSAKKAA